MVEPGAFLIIRTHAPDVRFRAFRDAVEPLYAVTASARLHEIELLEPGSVAAHTLILPFADKEAARDAWAAMPQALIAEPEPPLVLLTGAVPADGFDDPAIPTKANAAPGDDDGPVLLLIEGTGDDPARMDRYRDILLPMMFDLRAYYTVFDLGGSVEVLSGDWDEAIFAISRWTSRAAARAFWFSDRYQQDAIPIRLGHGRFEVAMVPETMHG